MKPHRENIEEILGRDLPSASKEEMEWDVARVLHQLRSRTDGGAEGPLDPRIAAFERADSFRWRRFAVIPTAAAVILAVFIAITWRQDAFAVVEKVEGSLYRIVDGKNQPLYVGEMVQVGTPVRTDDGSGAVLKLSDGARVEMHEKSELSLEHAGDDTRIRLNAGSVSVTPSKQPAGNLYVQNREATVPVVGATFQSAGAVTTPPGQTPAEPSPRFEVASVRPSSSVGGGGGPRGTGPAGGCSPGNIQIDPRRFAVSNISLYTLIAYAYSTERIEGNTSSPMRANALDLLSGGPAWIRTDCFDIQAAIPEGFPAYTWGQFIHADAPKLQKMLQNLLEDRFNVVLRHEPKEIPIYELRLGKNGAKRATIDGQDWLGTNTLKEKLPPGMAGSNSRGFFTTGLMLDPATGLASEIIAGRKTSMSEIISTLSLTVRRPVVDRTGLTGQVSFDIEFAPPNFTGPTVGGSIFYVLEDQLGLKLESTKGPVEVLIVDHAEKPSEN